MVILLARLAYLGVLVVAVGGFTFWWKYLGPRLGQGQRRGLWLGADLCSAWLRDYGLWTDNAPPSL